MIFITKCYKKVMDYISCCMIQLSHSFFILLILWKFLMRYIRVVIIVVLYIELIQSGKNVTEFWDIARFWIRYVCIFNNRRTYYKKILSTYVCLKKHLCFAQKKILMNLNIIFLDTCYEVITLLYKKHRNFL